jgi:hypothetical protein
VFALDLSFLFNQFNSALIQTDGNLLQLFLGFPSAIVILGSLVQAAEYWGAPVILVLPIQPSSILHGPADYRV